MVSETFENTESEEYDSGSSPDVLPGCENTSFASSLSQNDQNMIVEVRRMCCQVVKIQVLLVAYHKMIKRCTAQIVNIIKPKLVDAKLQIRVR